MIHGSVALRFRLKLTFIIFRSPPTSSHYVRKTMSSIIALQRSRLPIFAPHENVITSGLVV